MRRNELRGMTGGDVSHSSERRLLVRKASAGICSLFDFISFMFSYIAFAFI
jgi:hypothetical protein